MEPLKLIGDFFHISAMMILIRWMIIKQNCIGLSYKTQEIFLLVFITRYSSLFFQKKPLFFLVMKLLYIFLKIITIYMIRFLKPYKLTYDECYDKFPHWITIYPLAIILTVIFHVTFKSHPVYAYFWSFSIILEAFAIVP